MKPVPPYPLRFIAAWDWHNLRHAGQTMVKCRIETRDLKQVRESALKCFYQQYFCWQMLGVEWAEPMKFFNHTRCNSRRLAIVRTTMHNAVPDRRYCFAVGLLLKPIHENAYRSRMVRYLHTARKIVSHSQTFDVQRGVTLPNALDCTFIYPPQRSVGFEE